MLKFEKLVEVTTNRMSKIQINKNRCSKLRSPLSKCKKCIDICPVNSIEFKGKDLSLGDKCIECGLCAGVCPTSALSIQEPREINLYNHIEKNGKIKGQVVLSCKYDEIVSNDSLKVPCLGALTLEFLLAIDNLPFQVNLVFSKEKCKNCISKRGIDIYLENIEKIKKIEEKTNLKGGAILNTYKVPNIKKKNFTRDDEIDDERREFLTSIFKSVKKLPNTAIKYLLGTNEENNSKTVTSNPTYRKYPLFERIFSHKKEDESIDIEIENYLQPSLVGKCNFCRACSILCPMGAIKYLEKENQLKLFLIKDACSGCGLCTEVCYGKALELYPKKVGDFFSNTPYELAKGIVQSCKVCGQEIKSTETMEICSTCVKLGRTRRKQI